ncbi:MAG: ATP synthase F1 subunit gamma [Deltaproteobacteria bacterium]|nr:ATP synthase F1 subunit gamma [Deltaproteobacteria bacterium]MBN2846728.1 ATP synthase F1 subunit gamma [Deltaproteobacteria bacterium]
MAESLRDIKRQTQAVEKTKQITRAMNMVAASKLKTAQTRMENFRPYAKKIMEVLNSLARRVNTESNPLLTVREAKKVRVILMTSDRGLCGGFNTNTIKAVEGFIKYRTGQGQEVSLITVGKKGRDYFRKKATIIDQRVDVLNNFDISLAQAIGEEVIPSFIDEEYDELYIAYNEFKNVSQQRPVITRLLPVGSVEQEKEEAEVYGDYVYEPSEEELLAQIIPMYLRVLIYRGLLETSAGEHGARMAAMDNATNNCEEMIETLTLKYNKARQAAITAELMDIVGGTEALAKG